MASPATADLRQNFRQRALVHTMPRRATRARVGVNSSSSNYFRLRLETRFNRAAHGFRSATTPGSIPNARARLVGGHIWIDVCRPGIDPTGHVLRLRKSILAQPAGNPQTARSMVTVNNHRSVSEI